ncbi:thiol reductant ABC exporter subunit CydC [Candidatus Clostridium radicumherbarum]|uniref:Thiol reductant ABC exporter subunit CydC n=1 Tax=Candidatus Clostridium radicumherbarum TaxID=3381662 RepID=A0ABW8TQM9_9CLOT
MRILKVMNSLMKKHFFFVILSLLMGLLTIMSNVGMLSTSSVLISRAALHPDVLDLMVLIVAVRFFGISRGIFRYLERIFSHDTTFRILSGIRGWFYKNFNDNYSENNKNFKTGDIYTKVVNDVDTLKELFLRGIYPLITAVLTGILTSIFISYFSKAAAIIYLIIYTISGFVLPAVLFSFSKGYIEREAYIKKELNIAIIDSVKGVLEAALFSMRDKFSKDFAALSREYLKLQKKKNVLTAIGDNIYSLSASIIMALTLLITAPLIESGVLEGIYYAMLPLAIMASFEALIPMPNILYKFRESGNAGTNIFSIIDNGEPKEIKSNKEISNYNLFVNNLSVREDGESSEIIKDISFNLPYGKKLAIVGASGSGKSTLLRTLLGFMKYCSGEINLGEVSYREMDKEEIRKYFTYVDQNPYLFNTTIRENLLIANPASDEENIYNKLSEFNVKELTDELPDGINTMVGQFGLNFSGGEKQRLVLARAMLKDSKIVLLDEPTASLDVNLERMVIAAIQSEIADKSCIWVTHRLVGMDKMDEILVMDRGAIVERGTHKELVDRNGIYYKLWSIQQQLKTN